jgi:hypothetical protein
MTDNAIAKRKRTKGQTKIHKTLLLTETMVNMYHDTPTRTHYRDPESASLCSVNLSVFAVTPFYSLLSRHSAYIPCLDYLFVQILLGWGWIFMVCITLSTTNYQEKWIHLFNRWEDVVGMDSFRMNLFYIRHIHDTWKR